MLPRNLIVEWRASVERALMTRFPPTGMRLSDGAEEMINDLRQVEILGIQPMSLQKEIEICRAMRNEISARFPKASKEEKNVLKTLVLKCKEKMVDLENQHFKIETQCQIHENKIPNVPDENVPLWAGVSEFDDKYIKANLRFVNKLINEYHE